MAGARACSRQLSPARAWLVSAAFIILSVYVSEGRQCYWCGPLAEQVHRSRRAPPCEGGAPPVAACEPGYDHCAIVAITPPYLESRYCVKFYQDECYPLFCNSSKTWKMTCPCRGDLCNGANTEREQEAFSAIATLLARTHSHIKKRTPAMQFTNNRKGQIVNPTPTDDDLLADDLVKEEKTTPHYIQNDSLAIDKGDITDSNTATHTVSLQIPSPTKEESINGTNYHNSNAVAELNYGAIQGITMRNVDLESSSKQSSTVMIEIDILQKPNNNMIDENDLQADEPIHNFDQVANGDKKVKEGEEPNNDSKKEINEPDETTTVSLKFSSKSIDTNEDPHIDFTVKSTSKADPDNFVNLNESKSTENTPKIESNMTTPVLVNPGATTQKDIQTSSKEKLVTIAPTTHPVPGCTATASTTLSSKIKKDNNHAVKIFINTFSITVCALICYFI